LDGKPISAQLSSDDASFVFGAFVTNSTMEGTSQSAEADGQNESVLLGSALVFNPTGLIITSVWALLLMITMGYGTMVRIHARDTYRQRLKSRLHCGRGESRQS